MKINSVIFHKDFKKSFLKLNKKVRSEFHLRLKFFIEDQFHPALNNHFLHGEWENYWSINVSGDIRAIYEIKDRTAIFVEIGSHAQLYR